MGQPGSLLLFVFAIVAVPRAALADPNVWPDLGEVVPSYPVTPASEARSPEEPGPRFGAQGQWAVLGGTNVSLSTYSYDNSQAAGSSFDVSPELDYFFLRNVSVGLALDVSSGSSQGYGADGSLVHTRRTNVAGGVRFGLNVPLGRLFSWFPGLTVGYEWVRQDETLVSGQSLSISTPYPSPSTAQSGPYLAAYLPFLFHPVSHFFVGWGPEIFHDLGAVTGGSSTFGGQRTTLGVGFVAGGDWGGRSEPEKGTPAPKSTKTERRFGDEGEMVLTNSLVANVSWEGYAGLGSSGLGVSIGGSFDYFAIRHLSIGAFVEESFANTVGVDSATRAPTRSVSNTTTFGPRFGADVPMGRWLSTYFVGSADFSLRNDDETEGVAENKLQESIASVGLYIPILVHPAPHFFAGVGPAVYYEFSHDISFPNTPAAASIQNREVAFQIGSVVGGWF